MSCGKYQGSQIQYGVFEQDNVMVPMRDGVRLATDIYLPTLNGEPVEGRFPAILERTPYHNGNSSLTATGRYFAKRGYAVVLQDVRGRGESDGSWKGVVLATNEADDGYDTCDWIVRQPWSDGGIGTIGQSYTGCTQQALAVTNPPGLKAQFIIECGYNYHTHTMRTGGAFGLARLPYAFEMAAEGKEAQDDLVVRGALRDAARNVTEYMKYLPIKRGSTPLAFAPTYENMFLTLASHGDYDDLWKDPICNLEEHIDRHPDIPVMSTTSLYGHHVWASTTKFNELSVRIKAPLRLIIGPWLHSIISMSNTWTGEVDFGPDAVLDNLNDLRLKWFDQHLKGMHTDVLEGPPISVFVMGGGSGRRDAAGHMTHGGFWRHERRWPLGGTRFTSYYLHAGGGLGPDLPGRDAPPSRYTFDPRDPVPTVGGGGGQSDVASPGFLVVGAYDQRGRRDLKSCRDTMPLALRPDVLVFQTPPLDQDVEVTGPVEVNLWAASSAPDTDFTAKLVDVVPPNPDYPEGFAMNLCEGIVRARYRNSPEKAGLMQPGQVYAFRMDLQATCNLFKEGHRVRLEVSSSNFPRYDVNPNTGAPLWSSAETRVAQQSVYHDAERSSHVVLPIIPADRGLS